MKPYPNKESCLKVGNTPHFDIPGGRLKPWGLIPAFLPFIGMTACTGIQEEVFLSQRWAISKIIVQGDVQIFQKDAGGEEVLLVDSPLDSAYDFAGNELTATFEKDGSYALEAFPSRFLDLLVADTVGTWELDGDTLVLTGNFSGEVSKYALRDYSEEKADLVKDKTTETTLAAAGIREVRHEITTVRMVSKGLRSD